MEETVSKPFFNQKSELSARLFYGILWENLTLGMFVSKNWVYGLDRPIPYPLTVSQTKWLCLPVFVDFLEIDRCAH